MKKLSILFLGLFAAVSLWAAPFAQWFDFPGAGGKTYRIYGEGDEYSAWFEAEDGHAVWYSETLHGYEYQRKLADGSFAGTGILVGAEAGHEAELAAIPLHERDTSAKHADDRETRIRAKEERMGWKKNWETLKANHAARLEAVRLAEQGIHQAAPSSTTTGTIVGCTVLVDFPLDESGNGSLWEQQHSSVTAAKMENYLNGGEGVTEFGNACSVRQYYKEVSKGNLDYQNVLFGPVKLDHPRSYYDTDESDTVSGPRFVKDVIAAIKKTSDYSSKISQVSKLNSKVRALNIFFAGGESSTWSKGLWAHSYSISGDSTFSHYQISACTGSPSLYVFCHENGHMICDFPDLYNYSGRSHNLVGTRCLMADRSNARNPSAISGYLRYCAGWVQPKTLPNNTIVTIARDYGDVYKYTNPIQSKEYYLIENRGGGRDSSMGGSGLIIWHCYQSGNNTSIKDFNPAFSDRTDNTKYRLQNVELTMEQADGEYHMERSQGYNANDFWFSGNPAAGYPGVFSDYTVPTARWMDGSESGLELSEFSTIGDTMTFAVGTPVEAGAATITDDISASSYVGSGKLTVSSFGSGASSADVFVEIFAEATRKTLVGSIQVATGLSTTGQKTYTFPLVNGLTPQYVRFRVVNNLGKTAYGTLTEIVNGRGGSSSGGWDPTGGNSFGEAVDAPSLTINNSASHASYCYWGVYKDAYKTAPSCLRLYCSGNGSTTRNATLTTTVNGPGKFTFYLAKKFNTGTISSGSGSEAKVVFSVNGASKKEFSCKAGATVSWESFSVDLGSGANTLEWYGTWINPSTSSSDNAAIYIDQFSLEKEVPSTIPVAKITTSSLLPDRATVGVQVTDKAGETSVSATSIVVSPNKDYSNPVYTGAPGAVTGLAPLTRYYVQATLTGASGTTYPAIGSFVTPDWTKPTGAVSVSNLKHYSATVDVTVTNPGSETAANIVRTVTVAHDASFVEVLKSGVAVPCDLTGLEAGTTYYVRGILTGPLTGDTYVDSTFTTLSASYPVIGAVTLTDVGTDTASVQVTVSSFGDGSTGGNVLVEAIVGGVCKADAHGTGSGTYTLTGLDRDTEYMISVTATGSNGLIATDESLVVKTLNVPVILADPAASVGEEGASATMSARVAFREATVTDSNVKLYLTQAGGSESLVKTWNSYAQGDVLSFAADTEPNVDYAYRFVATTAWNSKNWTTEAAGEFRTEYYVTNDWLTVDFEDYAVNSALPASDASGAWTKAVGGVYESSSMVVDFASEFGKGKGLDQSGESTFAKYTATVARPEGVRCLSDADMYFTLCKVPPESLTDQVLATATTAIFLYSGDAANNFRIYTADGWIDVFAEGFEPANKTFHHVKLDIDYDATPARVRFTVDGHLLADANGSQWFDRANPSKTDMLTAVSVYGNTKLDGFSAKMLEYANDACPHANKQMTSAGQDATCTVAGHTAAYYCPDCERVWPSVEIPALGHAWDNGAITKPATYRETGVMTYTCTREGCGETRTETIEKPVCPHAHTTVTDAKAATCTTAGSTGTETCNDCDAIIHTATEIAALGHDWDAGVVTLEPTRTAEGIRTFTCKRTGCGATRTESIPMLPNLAAMRNIALVATVGQTLTLPAKVRGLKPDATLADEYSVSWQQASVTPSSEGITTVNGTVTVSPLTFPVKATIRAVKVSSPDTTPANIAPSATCSLSNSGVMFDGTLPTTSGKASTGAVSVSAGDVTLTWTDDKVISKAVIYFYWDKNSSQPNYSSVAFKNGTTSIGCGTPVWSKIYSKSNGSKDQCYQATYNFTSPVTLSTLKITLPTCQIEELEVYGTDVPTTVTADPLTTDTLASLKVDGAAVAGFSPTTYSYTVPDGEAITDATATDNANMGITILPKDDGKAYVVTLAENGSTKTYTVSMPPSVVCTHEHTTVTGAAAATCTTAGSTGTETCDACHAVLRTATVIPALGHDWSDWAVTKEASKTETGLRERNCQRVGCNAHEEEVIPMIVDIAALRNIAVVTAVGTEPTLPAKVAGLKADGTVDGEYDVVWNSAAAPSAAGITTVNGTAMVNGEPMSVTASVRAAVPATGEAVNVALGVHPTAYAESGIKYPKLSDQYALGLLTTGMYENDAFPVYALNTQGTEGEFDGKWAKDIFVFEFALAEPATVSGFCVWHMSDSGYLLDPYPALAEISTDNGNTWTEVAVTGGAKPGKLESVLNNNGTQTGVFKYVYSLASSAQAVTNVRFKMSPYGIKTPVPTDVQSDSKGFKIAEIEIFGVNGGSGGSVDPLTADTLTTLAVDNVAVAGFAPTTYAYTVTNGTAITSATSEDNVGITILPKYEGSAYVVTLAEDGESTKKYTVAMPTVTVCTHVHTTLTGAVAATCTTAGYTGDTVCDDCHETIQAGSVIPELGHDWGDWVTTKDPTETETGLKRRECQRDNCDAFEEQEIPMLASIVALRNVAVVTAVGTAPTLPEKVAGLKADGTVDGEYDVVWETSAAPSAAGITTVTGTATVNGAAMSVTASVRAVTVSSGGSGELVNIAPLASQMTVACSNGKDPGADIFNITNGWGKAMTIGGWNTPGNGWDIWPKSDELPFTATVDFTWPAAKKISKIFVASWDDNQHAAITLKNGLTGEALTGYAFTQDGDDYYKINQGDGDLYVFEQPVELSRLRIESTSSGRYLGFYEIEVWAEEGGSGGSIEPLTTDTLSALAVDGTPVAGFAPTTYAYTVENGAAITSATSEDNVGITILPKYEGSAYVVTLAEDGESTKKYTVAMPGDDPSATEVDVVVTKPDGTVETVTVDVDRLPDFIAGLDYGSKATLSKLTDPVTLLLAPGVHVKLAEDQTDGVVGFELPQTWYLRGDDADGAFAALDASQIVPAVVAMVMGPDGSVTITSGNAKSGLVYGVKHAATLVELDTETAVVEWLQASTLDGEIPLTPSAGSLGDSRFFRIVVTDDPRFLNASK